MLHIHDYIDYHHRFLCCSHYYLIIRNKLLISNFVCNCSMFCCTFLHVHSSIAIILMVKRELVTLLYLSSWCLLMVEWLFLAVPWGCLGFVIVEFLDHTHLLFLINHQVLQNTITTLQHDSFLLITVIKYTEFNIV